MMDKVYGFLANGSGGPRPEWMTPDMQQQQQQQALMGLAQGLLAASGPSRIPVSMGQALGQGLQGMQQGQDAYMDRVYKQAALGAKLQQAEGGGSLPAAIQIANEFQKARAAGDVQRMNDLAVAAKSFDKGVLTDAAGAAAPMPGYAQAVAGIAGTRAGAEQQARKGVDATMNPVIAGGEANARLTQELALKPRIEAATKTAETQAAGAQADAQVIPVIDQLRQFNRDTFEMPYAGAALPAARVMPGADVQRKVTNFDLLRQARTDLAAPLAKQLGVNPTDRDFQASLDRIFNENASRDSRSAQIDALEQRIRMRQAARAAPVELTRDTAADQQFRDVFDPQAAAAPPPPAGGGVDYKSKYGLK